MAKPGKIAFAIGCHPDDIEFMMAGTLILLKQAGYEIHYMNLANGSCGTATHTYRDIVRIRTKEGRNAAKHIGAAFHVPLVDDLDVFYDRETVARLAAVYRKVNPDILLVPSPEDYMEDHMNTCRMAVTAAFVRGMRNFVTKPRTKPVNKEVALYHALPWGLCDGLRRRIHPGQYVNIGSVLKLKREMLAMHKSQKEWLDHSQGLDAYLITMEDMCAAVGKLSKRFKHAEGWRRHSHLGFCGPDADPLADALKRKILTDPAYDDCGMGNAECGT